MESMLCSFISRQCSLSPLEISISNCDGTTLTNINSLYKEHITCSHMSFRLVADEVHHYVYVRCSEESSRSIADYNSNLQVFEQDRA
jgi:hypothetical protein